MSRFPGFPPDTRKFLRGLKKNNNREWFNARKDVYKEKVQAPLTELILALGEDVEKFAPGFNTDPKKATYRIHRDTRFSKDKTPYKTHIAGIFHHGGIAKHAGAAFYFHFDPDTVLIGGGLYMPDPKSLLAIRQRLSADHKSYRKIIGGKTFKNLFGEVEGERLKRVPKGFAADDPAADLLVQKQFLTSGSMPAKVIETAQFQRELVKHFKAIAPWIHWINEPLLP